MKTRRLLKKPTFTRLSHRKVSYVREVKTPADVLYLSEVTVRNNIATIMKERAKYRRNRKTRYRKARWFNRKNSIKTGRFSPTMRSKIDAHLKEIRFVRSLLPIPHIVLETGTFDPHALKNPEVLRGIRLFLSPFRSLRRCRE